MCIRDSVAARLRRWRFEDRQRLEKQHHHERLLRSSALRGPTHRTHQYNAAHRPGMTSPHTAAEQTGS
eukprot:5777306-Pyramimonas_sp.AAC.1